MKSYIYAIVLAIIISFIIGSGWYTIFSYDPYLPMFDNLKLIYSNTSFWRGTAIWSVLYTVFLTLPITFLKHRNNKS